MPHPRRGSRVARLVVSAGLLLTAVAAAPPTASATQRIVSAGRAAGAADHTLVVTARAVAGCAGGCAPKRVAVQQAGGRFTASIGRMARAARTRASATTVRRAVPVITVSGRTLSWTRVGKVRTYVLARDVPGQRPVYMLVSDTRTIPPAVPGVSVRYAVRTAVDGSRWSAKRAITYPGVAAVGVPVAGDPASGASAGVSAPASPSAATRQTTSSVPAIPESAVDAPEITITGLSLTWDRVASVTDYVLVRKLSGAADAYSVVRGTSATPEAAPGRTVTYSVRTAVDGSAWAPERTITYPASPAPEAAPPAPAAAPAQAPAPASSPHPAPVPGGAFEFGINSGSAVQWQLGFIQPLGARHTRMEFDISTPVSTIAPIVESYARAGVQPLLLAGFDGRLPSVAEAQGLARWAAAFGPGGTLWAGKGLPASVQISEIEFGNETNNPYQYGDGSRGSDWYTDPAFLQRAETYALRLKDAHIAIQAANPSVGLLAVADQYSGYTTWLDAMFAAVPDLGDDVAGWTVHPYGRDWRIPMDTMLGALSRHGAPDKPLYATEWGLSTDGGRCLSDNYGWDRCMGFDQAAATLADAVAAMRSRYGARLAAIYLYSTSDLAAPGASTDREHYFGALRGDRSAKGAYTTEVQRLLAASA